MISKEIRNYIEKTFKQKAVVCLTGAGISAESGIPTFRGKGGLWEKYDPEIYAHPEGLIALLKEHPEKLVNFIIDFYTVLLKASPNPAHFALAELEKKGILEAVITQNIDNLHQRAGSQKVIELHGNSFRIRCMRCVKSITFTNERIKEMLELMKRNQHSYLKLLKILSAYFPRCECGGRYRIDIVLFGEMLPQDGLSEAYRQLERCKVLLVIGTSLVVYPAASLPVYAKQSGAKLIEINNAPGALQDQCDYRITGRAKEILPEIQNILGDA